MNTLRPDLPELPIRMRALPVDARGYPVPWFAAWLDEDGRACPRGSGTPDFRVVTPRAVIQAYEHSLCWICGEKLGTFRSFVIGPMCALNRTSSEPPSHLDCADFAARACPFLTRPKERRNSHEMPPGHHPGAGVAIQRNPGVALVWTTRRFIPYQVKPRAGVDSGVLFDIGHPVHCRWYREGRPATRAEVLESIDTGLPILRDLALPDGPEAVADLDRAYQAALPLLPAS